MYRVERELFKKAILEAMIQKHDEELDACDEDSSCSAAYRQKMSVLLGRRAEESKQKASRTKKRTLIAILAAVLLLVGCTAFVYREKIKNFVLDFYEQFIVVTVDNDETGEETLAPQDKPKKITEFYALSYVPEGYVLADRLCVSSINLCQWKNESGDIFTFEQTLLDRTSFILDAESGDSTLLNIVGFDVYYRSLGSHCYLWNDGKYCMTIRTTDPLSEETLARVIEGITEKED